LIGKANIENSTKIKKWFLGKIENRKYNESESSLCWGSPRILQQISSRTPTETRRRTEYPSMWFPKEIFRIFFKNFQKHLDYNGRFLSAATPKHIK